MTLVGDAEGRLQEVYCLFFPATECPMGRATQYIIDSVSLLLSFDSIAIDDLLGTSAKDDAER